MACRCRKRKSARQLRCPILMQPDSPQLGLFGPDLLLSASQEFQQRICQLSEHTTVSQALSCWIHSKTGANQQPWVLILNFPTTTSFAVLSFESNKCLQNIYFNSSQAVRALSYMPTVGRLTRASVGLTVSLDRTLCLLARQTSCLRRNQRKEAAARRFGSFDS